MRRQGSVSPDRRDGRRLFCNQCFNQDNGDGIAALQWLRGGTFPETVNALAEYLGQSSHRPNEAAGNGKPKIVATYNYVDVQGKLLYQVVRFEPKDFRQRRPKDGGGWEYTVKGTRLVPYRLPDLLAAPSSCAVFVVEGEKDADRAASMGIVATTCAMGAGKWRPEYNEHFRGRSVCIVPDNDKPGREHANQVAQLLCGMAGSIKVVELPGVPEKGDLSDWLDQGGTKDKLAERVKAAQEWWPSPGDKQPPAFGAIDRYSYSPALHVAGTGFVASHLAAGGHRRVVTDRGDHEPCGGTEGKEVMARLQFGPIGNKRRQLVGEVSLRSLASSHSRCRVAP